MSYPTDETLEAIDKLDCSALNEASWELHKQMSEFEHVSPVVFNNLKGCLAKAINLYNEKVK